jgi:hypothetical protein
MDPKARREGENSTASGPARFGGLDQLDWLMIVMAVLLGTAARRYHVLGLPDRFLEWVLPFLLMVAGYKARRKVTELIESRRAQAKRPTSK